MVGCDGNLTMVCCKVCSEIERQEKLLGPKFDSLQKHASRQKCKVTSPECVVGQYFMSTVNQMQRMNAYGRARVKAQLLTWYVLKELM